MNMDFESYKIRQGKIMIAFSDENLSVGILEINPGQKLSKHNRPVLESLFQVKGTCVMKIFEEDGSAKEIIMNEGDSIGIEPEKFHIHSNQSDDVSITFWKATGDITEIINKIRQNQKM